MPDDSTFDYLPTQAIGDYLANVRDPRLDGIAFPSSQTSKDAVNVVLFHRASRVERRVKADGLKVEVSEDVDADTGGGFSVIEMESKPKDAPTDGPRVSGAGVAAFGKAERSEVADSWWMGNDDDREESLRLDAESIEVHRVAGVSYETDELPVRRMRVGAESPLFGDASSVSLDD